MIILRHGLSAYAVRLAMFHDAKHGQPYDKRPSFEFQKTAFCNTLCIRVLFVSFFHLPEHGLFGVVFV